MFAKMSSQRDRRDYGSVQIESNSRGIILTMNSVNWIAKRTISMIRFSYREARVLREEG